MAAAPVAIVTGASRGAGRGIARALGAHGCTVYVTGRSEKEGDASVPGTIYATAEEVTQAGGNGIAVRCDSSDDAQIKALIDRVVAEQGRIDILVNNACYMSDSISAPGQFWEKPVEIGNMLTVGVRSGFITSWYAAQHMVKQDKGLIVFTSSPGSMHYCFGPGYGGHKAGLDKMAFDMGVDFADAGVNVAAVSVWMGSLATERLLAMIEEMPDRFAYLEGTLGIARLYRPCRLGDLQRSRHEALQRQDHYRRRSGQGLWHHRHWRQVSAIEPRHDRRFAAAIPSLQDQIASGLPNMRLTRKELLTLAGLVAAAAALSFVLRSTWPVGDDVGDLASVREILADRQSPSRETAGADVTLVVFTDYQCGACRLANGAMMAALRRDPKVRVVYKDWPIFGARSQRAARIALAASYQGIYPALHHALMESPGVEDADLQREIAAAGGNWEQVLRDLERHGGEIDAQLARNATQAYALGLGGTPGYLAGPYLVRGAMDEGEFIRAFGGHGGKYPNFTWRSGMCWL